MTTGVRFVVGLVVVCIAACAGSPRAKRPTTGAITGLVRDMKTGEFIALAELTVDGRVTKSNAYGMYTFDHVRPGVHTLRGVFAGQPVTIKGIDVTAGMASYADVVFTLGDVTPIETTWGDPREGEIRSFTAKVPRIEGTVGDASTRERIAGAVVTAVGGGATQQTVTDEHGRYRFDAVTPGTYAISAYYSIGDRAQIEVRRSEIVVGDAEGVLVPLWIELAKQ